MLCCELNFIPFKRYRLLLKLTIITLITLLSAVLGFGCRTPSSNTSIAAVTTEMVKTADTGSTQLTPIIVPTLPNTIPAYLEVDPDTGLHMTGRPTVVDFDTYRLKVSGLVNNELSLSYDEIRLLPKLTATPPLVCSGYFEDYATWSGASLQSILEMAKVKPGATMISLKSADGYSASIDLAKALNPDHFLAYELAGKTLPVLQGFPLRVVFPGQDGHLWVKWLIEIEVK